MEPRMEDVFALYEQKVAPLSSAQREKLLAARDEGMTPFVMGCAILRAKQEQRRSRLAGKEKHISFNYIHRIIEDWLNHGITTEERFRVYWSAITEDQHKNGGEKAHGAQEKIRREDFTYTPSKQDRSLFSFLDD
ncbi:DnaD domain protein [Candidatus Darwinibacter acetoxidans]